jgi:hypothetical protein
LCDSLAWLRNSRIAALATRPFRVLLAGDSESMRSVGVCACGGLTGQSQQQLLRSRSANLQRPVAYGLARFLARHFTRKPRAADHAPGLPAESNARARQKRSAFGSDVVENCEAVKAVWFTTVVENVFDVLT